MRNPIPWPAGVLFGIATVAALGAMGCNATVATGERGLHANFGEPAEDGALRWRSTYPDVIDGLTMVPGQDHAVAGMWGNTCQLAFLDGDVPYDADVQDGDETVFDVFPGDDSDIVIVGGGDTLREVALPSGDVVAEHAAPGTLAARDTDAHLVALRLDGDCRVDWLADDHVHSMVVDLSFCATAAIETSAAGDVWLADGERVVALGPEGGLTLLAHDADIVRLDAVADRLLLASDRGDVVRSLDRSGAVAWTARVDGEIRGMDDMSGLRLVAVAVAVQSAPDEVVLLDADTGEVVASQLLRHDAGALVAAPDGRAIGILQHTGVDFFTLGEGLSAR